MDPRFFLPCFYGPRASRLGHKRKEKTRSITCPTDRANEANKRLVLLLYFTLLYFTLLYFTLLYFTLLYFTLLYFTLLYFTLLYLNVLYFTILYCTVLYCTLLLLLLYFTSCRHGFTLCWSNLKNTIYLLKLRISSWSFILDFWYFRLSITLIFLFLFGSLFRYSVLYHKSYAVHFAGESSPHEW